MDKSLCDRRVKRRESLFRGERGGSVGQSHRVGGRVLVLEGWSWVSSSEKSLWGVRLILVCRGGGVGAR